MSAFFPGKLAAIAESLVLEDDPRPHVPGAALLDGDRLRRMLSAFATNYAEPDEQAVATQWSKWHFSQLLPPALIANIAADWLLPTAIDRIGIVLSPDSRTLAIRLPGEGARLPVSGVQRFWPLVEDHLAPLIAAISRASGLPAKTLWSNAGNVAETIVSECAAFLGEAHPGVTDARALLATRLWPDGRKNDLFEPVRYREGRRRRRLCCLRYRIASLSLCKSCPLDKVPRGSGRSEQQGTS
ncbi:siderophore-iron reductase FhuF [Mesorhizobium sp. YC-39]|uniref:siderophore-iron reductase FhuF n=1 Tax=unclassified Mesorhizobium TaxID=325217 RepID=UPI0021E7AEB3|nr:MULTISPECIES: siderophore-iron reductase FhuF [unclassified Mesorhizobium]MCV3208006.1 siderophore-iron reductase FhuF [Mesorhizobium sp. YC-2]MCV3229733.1 siderophore-iron reductase FhuF [Mesorhizobium sp. YC-39]